MLQFSPTLRESKVPIYFPVVFSSCPLWAVKNPPFTSPSTLRFNDIISKLHISKSYMSQNVTNTEICSVGGFVKEELLSVACHSTLHLAKSENNPSKPTKTKQKAGMESAISGQLLPQPSSSFTNPTFPPAERAARFLSLTEATNACATGHLLNEDY